MVHCVPQVPYNLNWDEITITATNNYDEGFIELTVPNAVKGPFNILRKDDQTDGYERLDFVVLDSDSPFKYKDFTGE
jgi:hypothetical protein